MLLRFVWGHKVSEWGSGWFRLSNYSRPMYHSRRSINSYRTESDQVLNEASFIESSVSAVCGIIMPISATENRTEAHWKNVLKLCHRAIMNAGFEPKNVWESSATDRISERIVGNLFDFPMVIADISDLNANVMFELGLRIASKKPTIIICNEGGPMPFDIRDFEAIFYPGDLNIIGIEEFFKKLEKSLKDKFDRYKREDYQPFLANVIVDVASPQTRELELNDLILSRLDELARKIASVENQVKIRTSTPLGRKLQEISEAVMRVEIPTSQIEDFIEEAGSIFDIDEVEAVLESKDVTTFRVDISSPNIHRSRSVVRNLAHKYGGDEEIPF